MFHSSLRIKRENTRVFPNVIKRILKRVNKIINLTEVESIDFRDRCVDFSKMIFDNVSFLTELLILLVSDVFGFKLVPKFDFIDRA